jgi:hypothetical protein
LVDALKNFCGARSGNNFPSLHIERVVRIDSLHVLLVPVEVGELINQAQPVGDNGLGRIAPGVVEFGPDFTFEEVRKRPVFPQRLFGLLDESIRDTGGLFREIVRGKRGRLV